jgi:hypothetical protein
MTYPVTCPRLPPGGAYQIGNTDEHGATTTVTVPALVGCSMSWSHFPAPLLLFP